MRFGRRRVGLFCPGKDRQQRFFSCSIDPHGDAGFLEKRHQKQRSEHANGIARLALPCWTVQGLEDGNRLVKIKLCNDAGLFEVAIQGFLE